MADDLPERLALPASRAQSGLFAVICALFVAGGIWMVWTGEPWGWLAIGVFGLGAGVFVAFMGNDLGLTLDREGFELRTLLRRKRYAWLEVSDFHPHEAEGAVMIVFDDLRRKPGWLSWLNRLIIGRNEWIAGAIIGAPLEETCAWLNAFRARACARAQ